jgi:GH15 family glucan-1,4-alpha-glucosidase
MDSIYLYNKYASPLSYDTWVNIVSILTWLADNWNKIDEGIRKEDFDQIFLGIWEMRSGKKNYVYSRVMCWVAFDRGIRLADKRSFPCPRAKWLESKTLCYH